MTREKQPNKHIPDAMEASHMHTNKQMSNSLVPGESSSLPLPLPSSLSSSSSSSSMSSSSLSSSLSSSSQSQSQSLSSSNPHSDRSNQSRQQSHPAHPSSDIFNIWNTENSSHSKAPAAATVPKEAATEKINPKTIATTTSTAKTTPSLLDDAAASTQAFHPRSRKNSSSSEFSAGADFWKTLNGLESSSSMHSQMHALNVSNDLRNAESSSDFDLNSNPFSTNLNPPLQPPLSPGLPMNPDTMLWSGDLFEAFKLPAADLSSTFTTTADSAAVQALKPMSSATQTNETSSSILSQIPTPTEPESAFPTPSIHQHLNHQNQMQNHKNLNHLTIQVPPNVLANDTFLTQSLNPNPSMHSSSSSLPHSSSSVSIVNPTEYIQSLDSSSIINASQLNNANQSNDINPTATNTNSNLANPILNPLEQKYISQFLDLFMNDTTLSQFDFEFPLNSADSSTQPATVDLGGNYFNSQTMDVGGIQPSLVNNGTSGFLDQQNRDNRANSARTRQSSSLSGAIIDDLNEMRQRNISEGGIDGSGAMEVDGGNASSYLSYQQSHPNSINSISIPVNIPDHSQVLLNQPNSLIIPNLQSLQSVSNMNLPLLNQQYSASAPASVSPAAMMANANRDANKDGSTGSNANNSNHKRKNPPMNFNTGKNTRRESPAAPGHSSSSSSNANPASTGSGTKTKTNGKRASHIASEKKRRTTIRQGFQDLIDIVPELKETRERVGDSVSEVTPTTTAPSSRKSKKNSAGDKDGNDQGEEQGVVRGGHAISKATILNKSVEFIQYLQKRIGKLNSEMQRLEGTLGLPITKTSSGHATPPGSNEGRNTHSQQQQSQNSIHLQNQITSHNDTITINGIPVRIVPVPVPSGSTSSSTPSSSTPPSSSHLPNASSSSSLQSYIQQALSNSNNSSNNPHSQNYQPQQQQQQQQMLGQHQTVLLNANGTLVSVPISINGMNSIGVGMGINKNG